MDRCSSVAAQRAEDAALNGYLDGYGRDMQRQIYDITYQSCETRRQQDMP